MLKKFWLILFIVNSILVPLNLIFFKNQSVETLLLELNYLILLKTIYLLYENSVLKMRIKN